MEMFYLLSFMPLCIRQKETQKNFPVFRIALVYIWEEIFIYIHPYTGGMSLGKRENIESHTIRYDHYFKTTDSFLTCAGWSIHCYPGIVLRQGIRSNTLH